MIFGDLRIVIYLIPVILLSLSFHEFSHGYISYKLGDPTAKNMGRLTLNPLKHLDILGTIMILVSKFGWAKPVPINPLFYRNRKKGTIIVSIAGPLSNIFLAFVFSFPLYYLRLKYHIGVEYIQSFTYIPVYIAVIYNFCSMFLIININLAVFNIIPVPPLDGSKILSGILPQRQYFKLMEYENYIGLVFLLLIFVFPGVLGRILYPLYWVVETAIGFIAVPIAGLFV